MSRNVLGDNYTDWFNCPLGVKQGDCISPTLFSMFINDLANDLHQSGVGIPLDLPAPTSSPDPAPTVTAAPDPTPTPDQSMINSL